MNTDQIQSIIRTLLTSGGAYLVTKGIINNGQLQEIIGAILALGSVAWSLWQKRESAKLAKAVAVVNASPHTEGDAASGTVTINPAPTTP